jgi:gas vesicle protein
MNSSFSITTLQSVIYIAALVPFLIALIMWVAFYIKYDYGKLGKIEYVFKRLADDGEKIKECSKENISFMDEMIVRMAPTYFLETWIRMKMQLDKNYDGDYIPDGQSFYPFDSMITVPGCRNRMESMWKTFWVLGLLTVLLPVGAALFIQPEAILNALFLGVIIFVLSCVTYLIFTLIDQKSYFNTKTQYYRFINTFDRILPVAKPEVALLLEATQRNKETYESATGKIVEKFNNIVDDMILPVLEGSIYTIMHSNLIPAIHNIEKTLDDNMNKTMELQEKGMRDLASDFVDSLGNTISEKLKELAETINIVQNNMKLLNDNLNSQVNTLTQTISESLQAHQEHTAKTKEFQDQSLEHLKEHITNTIEFQNHSLELHKEQLNKAIEVQDGSLNRQKEFIAEAIALQNQALEIQKEHIIEAMKLQDQQMKQSLDLHEQSLSKITSSFSESFTNTVEARIADLAMTISGVGGQIDDFAFKAIVLLHTVRAGTEHFPAVTKYHATRR